MLRRVLIHILVLTLFALTGASGSLLYLCHMDQQAHQSCCCAGMDETSPCSQHEQADTCCDIQLVQNEPVRVNRISQLNVLQALPLVALPVCIAGTPSCRDSTARFRTYALGVCQAAPPIFLQNWSHLI